MALEAQPAPPFSKAPEVARYMHPHVAFFDRPSLGMGATLFAALLVRVLVAFAYRPIWSGDSPGYAEFYFYLRHGIFYLGERTPVYPFFLGFAQFLAGSAPAAILSPRAAQIAYLLQAAFDVMAVLVFRALLRKLKIRGFLAFFTSVGFASIPAICLYEVNILNMSLAVAAVLAVAWCFVQTMDRAGREAPVTRAAFLLGLAMAFATLLRPEMLIFSAMLLLLLFVYVLRSAGQVRHLTARAALVATTTLAVPVLSWMSFMWVGIGQFRVTTLDGWNRSRTTYNLFDRVGPEDRVLGGLYTHAYRRSLTRGLNVNLRETMWQIYIELTDRRPQYPYPDPLAEQSESMRKARASAMESLGLHTISCAEDRQDYCWERIRAKIDTGDYLGKVSNKLARRYPLDWLKNIAVNFGEEAFNFRYVDVKAAIQGATPRDVQEQDPTKRPDLAAALNQAVVLEAPLLLFCFVFALVYTGASPFVFSRKANTARVPDYAVTALATSSVTTLVVMCALEGLNRAYHLPFLSVFLLCTAYAFQNRRRIRDAVR